MLEGIKAVIFDLDGTLVDSMWVWNAVDEAFLVKHNLIGVSEPADLKAKMEGKSFSEVAALFKETFNVEASIEEIKADWLQITLDKYMNEVPLKEGALEFLQYLQASGRRIGIATSNSRALVDVVLKAKGIDTYIEYFCTSCEVGAGKPAPDVYLNVAEYFNVKPEECLVFEDVVKGIEAGLNANMRVCAIEDDYSMYQKEEKVEKATYYIKNYSEIVR